MTSLAVAAPAFAVARAAFTARRGAFAAVWAVFCAALAERSATFTAWREFLIPALDALTAFSPLEAAFFAARLAGPAALVLAVPGLSRLWDGGENEGTSGAGGRGDCPMVPF